MLTWLGYIDGKWQTIYGIHTDPSWDRSGLWRGQKMNSTCEDFATLIASWSSWSPGGVRRHRWQLSITSVQVFTCVYMNMEVSKNGGTPKRMIYSRNPLKMDDLGVSLFEEAPISITSMEKTLVFFIARLDLARLLGGWSTSLLIHQRQQILNATVPKL